MKMESSFSKRGQIASTITWIVGFVVLFFLSCAKLAQTKKNNLGGATLTVSYLLILERQNQGSRVTRFINLS